MAVRVDARELEVHRGELTLGGALWARGRDAVATVLMHPGSGPSDRDNDVYFPPIREHLLERGIAIASFDKRGVGRSTGRWEDAGIEAQAEDALACVAALREADAPGPIGLYGHSQGGWVVVEAASRDPDVAFVIANSGPGVTPGEQERYSLQAATRARGVGPRELEEVDRLFDRLLALARDRVPLEEVRLLVARESFPAVVEELDFPLLPDDPAVWELVCSIVDYDPSPALDRIRVPVLALFGEDDAIVPVEESVRVYREAVLPDLLTVVAFAAANHRMHVGDPPRLADTYLETVTDFVLGAVA
jgi:uncharacterized protein